MLNNKQERFAQEYVVDLNATQAATRAGYSARTANEQGSRLLAHASVQERINELSEAAAKRNDVTVDGVLENLARLRDKAEENGQLSAAVRAEELIGKYLAMFVDRQKFEDARLNQMSDEDWVSTLPFSDATKAAILRDLDPGKASLN